MKKTVYFVILMIVVVAAISSLGFGVTPQDVKKQERPIYVLTPKVPKEAEKTALEFALSKEVYIDPDEQPRISGGFALFDSERGVWLDEYLFIIWHNQEWSYSFYVTKDDDTQKYVCKEDNYSNNDLRIHTSEQHPAVIYRYSETGKVAIGQNTKDVTYYYNGSWIFGKDTDCPASIRNDLHDRTVSVLSLSPEKARYFPFKKWESREAYVEAYLLPKYPNYGLERQPWELSDDQLIAAVKEIYPNAVWQDREISSAWSYGIFSEGEYQSELIGGEIFYVTREEAEKLLTEGGFSDPGRDQAIYLLTAATWISVPGYADPFSLQYKTLVDESGKVLGGWLSAQTFWVNREENDPNYADYREMLMTLVSNYTGYVDGAYDDYAHYLNFPATTPLEDIVEAVQKQYAIAGYARKSYSPAQMGYDLAGCKIMPEANQVIVTYFKTLGWNIDSAAFLVSFDTGFSDIESKQAEMAAYQSAAWWPDVIKFYGSDRYEVPRYFFGISDPRRSHNGPRLLDEGFFHARQSFYIAENVPRYDIDFCYNCSSMDRFVFLIVRPGVPNRAGVYERFFYPISATSEAIHRDMQDYYREQGKRV